MRRTKQQKVKKRKKQVARTPIAVTKYKTNFLKQLAKGKSPGAAAQVVKIARCTAYKWKSEDAEFASAWIDAVETGLDLLETRVMERGLADSASDAQFMLRARRPEVYGRTNEATSRSDFIVRVTLEEHFKRLERLGIQVPVIETDYEFEETEGGPSDRDRS
jgi:hypothetical protein